MGKRFVEIVRRLPVEKKTCPQCGKKFEGVETRLYCSASCRRKASYIRHAEEYRQERRERYRRQKERAAKKV